MVAPPFPETLVESKAEGAGPLYVAADREDCAKAAPVYVTERSKSSGKGEDKPNAAADDSQQAAPAAEDPKAEADVTDDARNDDVDAAAAEDEGGKKHEPHSTITSSADRKRFKEQVNNVRTRDAHVHSQP